MDDVLVLGSCHGVLQAGTALRRSPGNGRGGGRPARPRETARGGGFLRWASHQRIEDGLAAS
jgi:hypothetical protein